MYFPMDGSLSPEAVLPLLHGRLGRPYEHVVSTPSTQRLERRYDDWVSGAR